MPQIRRSTDRRRRVIYQTHSATQSHSTPAARRDAERLRAARQPAKTFGSRVGQPLRGRWFSLVPVSRAMMVFVGTVILAIPTLLTTLHYVSYTWPALAYNEAVARPFRIQLSDSFASWWISIGLLVSAGATLLIFQLRRHRADDYRGHYRLWRTALIVLLVANLNHTVGFVQWLGALLDLAFGNRAVMSGANWLRIVLDVGGVILAMQLIAEVFRCRSVLIAMLATISFLGFMELATWNVIAVESPWVGTLLLASPLLAVSCYLLSATLYLRTLYRQARNITHHTSVRDQLSSWWAEFRDSGGEVEFPELEPAAPKIAVATRRAAPSPAEPNRRVDQRSQESTSQSSVQQEDVEDESTGTTRKERRGLFSRFKRSGKAQDSPEKQTEDRADQNSKSESKNQSSDKEKSKRGLFRRRPKQTDVPENEGDAGSKKSPEQAKPKKKGRFSLRLRPQQQDVDDQQQSDQATAKPDSVKDEESSKAEKPRGLFRRMFSGKPKSESDSAEADTPEAGQSQSNRQPSQTNPGKQTKPSGPDRNSQQRPAPLAQRKAATQPTDSEDIDPNDIDWNSLSKSERRRLRKKLKRSGHAA